MAEGLPDAVLGGVINRATIEENWAEVLRLAACESAPNRGSGALSMMLGGSP